MPSDQTVLAFDTSAAHCAAALFCNGRVVATRVDEMGRGQAEHLMPMLETFLADHDLDWSRLTRIGVGIGPGNFTGIRISVSAARGLALGLGIPAIGVSSLDAIHRMHPNAFAAVPAPREMIYTQPPGGTPELRPSADVPEAVFADNPHRLIAAIAECAAEAQAEQAGRPKPLYVKPADAAPSRDTAPVILS
ncbi:tRNA (adenosine(37)-N6)-threonylcarbamoyltransferase complex dimerization subunit type 1 TsaB [Marivita geojedonensis]|uniref:Peptidase M22 n=1 Tax=Marivita geojedonensis TaxID=1123756 RepID=A0A1X4NPL5_9RHOB|nr:tRNA (adenosine(37)-N6)-threonylcarbamoyltransferase complex dimerization subunit type 1 TsaB [Marivita geojedonensis]OSQ52506.1 peptidase M22 [Marivita geojedonensis]PRY80687.1 tRNA threonylcarbamoyl adenosine modification protein YeaZ [Marivita geojedonensis]